MVWLLGLFIVEVLLLTQLKKEMVTLLWKFLHAVSGSAHLGVWLYAIVFFPGTVLHELSHLLAAVLLRVKTSEIALFPKTSSGYVTLGYVKVAQTDPFRSLLIGIAPFCTGLIMLVGIVYLQFHTVFNELQGTSALWQHALSSVKDPVTWFAFYIIIVISHAMFLSEADKSEVYLIPIAAAVMGVSIYFLRNYVSLSEGTVGVITSGLTLVTISLATVLVFNMLFLLVLLGLKALFGKLF